MEKSKVFLFKSLAVSSLVVAAAVFWGVNTLSKTVEVRDSFQVSGEGKAVVIPDVARLTFSVITEGEDLLSLQADNSQKINKVIKFIKSRGSVEDKDIQTTDYSITPRYQRYNCRPSLGEVKPCPPPEIVGYKINQSIAVKVRDFSKIGDLLAGAVENGANSVSGPSFTVDDVEKVKEEARAKAIAQAKNKAKAIAKAAGFRLGRILSVSESGYVPPVYYSVAMKESAESPPAPAPIIEPGSKEIKTSVTLRYEIK